MKHLPCERTVQNPWQALHYTNQPYQVTSCCYEQDGYFISKLGDENWLYYFQSGNSYYAFNQLAGFFPEHIDKIKAHLIGEESKDWLVKRAAETIKDWKKENYQETFNKPAKIQKELFL